MESPAGRRKVWRPLSLCLQADEQGLLKGDLNMVQVAAISLVRSNNIYERRGELKAKHSYIDDLIDLYLKLNHPKVFEELEHERMLNEEKPDQELVAQDMNEMLDKMLQLAGMS